MYFCIFAFSFFFCVYLVKCFRCNGEASKDGSFDKNWLLHHVNVYIVLFCIVDIVNINMRNKYSFINLIKWQFQKSSPKISIFRGL